MAMRPSGEISDVINTVGFSPEVLAFTGAAADFSSGASSVLSAGGSLTLCDGVEALAEALLETELPLGAELQPANSEIHRTVVTSTLSFFFILILLISHFVRIVSSVFSGFAFILAELAFRWNDKIAIVPRTKRLG